MGAAIASQNLNALPTFPEHEHRVDIVSVDGHTFNQIVEYIVDAHRRGTESIISLRYPADSAWDLGVRLDEKLVDLEQLKIRRFETTTSPASPISTSCLKTHSTPSSWIGPSSTSYPALFDSP